MNDLGGNGLRAHLRTRLAAGCAAALTVVAGLGVRSVPGGEFAKCAGDALYTVLLYALLVLAAPRLRPGRAALLAAALSWAVELFQLTGLPDAWGRHSTPVRLVLGSTFNPPDLLWYLVGAGCAGLLHRVLRSSRTAAPGGA